MKRKKQWIYSPKKVWPLVPSETQQSVIGLTEPVISRLILRYFESHNHRSKDSLMEITSHWRRCYFYVVANYHTTAKNAISSDYEENLARLEYVGPDRYNLSYFRHTGVWFEIARDQSLNDCLAIIAENSFFHPL
ncbi:MAG: hypothetical protein ACD_40C00123G0005 [uncultured bacterium]|nr:MAG: hypothetical protein ACD_40C00123G0005 [uncultured bacterium]